MSEPVTCAWCEERLPLLLYEEELAPDERAALEAHLAGCAGCSETREALDATAAVLSAAAPPPLRADQRAALKERVLAAVACPEEPRLLGEPEEVAELTAHLEGCASCRGAERDFVRVGRALDVSTVPPLSAEAREALRQRVLACVGPACPQELELFEHPLATPVARHLERCAACREARADFAKVAFALDLLPPVGLTAEQRGRLREGLRRELGPSALGEGRLVRLPAVLLRAAAAVLVAASLGLAWSATRPEVEPRVPEPLALLRQEADALARAGDRTLIPITRDRFKRMLVLASEGGQVALVDRARRELEALAQVDQQVASTHGGSGGPSPQAILVSYQPLIVQYPETTATLHVLKRALPQAGTRLSARPVTDDPQQRRASRTKVLRHDYEDLAKLVDPKLVLDRSLRQAVVLQRGLHAEELWQLTGSEDHRREALALFEETLTLGADTRAAAVAQEALGRLRG